MSLFWIQVDNSHVPLPHLLQINSTYNPNDERRWYLEFYHRRKTFELLFSDQSSSSSLSILGSEMTCDKVNIFYHEKGIKHYKMHLSEREHLISDPNFPCAHCGKAGHFDQCIKNEIWKELNKTDWS